MRNYVDHMLYGLAPTPFQCHIEQLLKLADAARQTSVHL